MKTTVALRRGALMIGTLATLACVSVEAAEKTANERAYDEARELADKIKNATGTGSRNAAVILPKGDPCRLLTDAEVRKVFPKAAAAKPERTREEYGIAACLWDHPAGRFVVQLTNAKPKSTADEARGLASGFVDPLKSGAARNIRLEKIAGVGDEAVAVVEQQDANKGILADAAYLITQRGDRQVLIMAMDLARGDRTVALKALDELARAAVGRL